MGVPKVVTVPPVCSESGCVDVNQLEDQVVRARANGLNPVVCGVLGGTVNGHVDDLAALAEVW